jgi:hypothetical protein
MATVSDIQLALQIQQANLAQDRAALSADPTNTALQQQVQQDLSLIDSLNAQLAAAQTTPTASAGTVVADDQLATAPGSLPQTPNSTAQVVAPDGRITPVPETTSGTNATLPVDSATSNTDTGTDAPTVTIQQSQATPAAAPGLLANPGPVVNTTGGGVNGDGTTTAPAPSPTQIGAGAGNDDSGATTKNATQTEVDNVFSSNNITPQPNVLGQYASYTYRASVYLMSAQAYTTMCQTQQKNLQGCQLLFQSGGAPIDGRNPYFPYDYYIDKITLESTISGKGTNLSHNVNSIKMTVIENNGITLINNLDKALNAALGPGEKKQNFNAQQYLLVIRFYGYDQYGNLVQANNTSANPFGLTDPSAFVEKFYPMCITNIRFKVANKLVEYDIEATSVPYNINVSSNRGSIPYNVELSSGTVKDVLAGSLETATGQTTAVGDTAGTTNNTNSTTIPPAPAKANAATSVVPTIRQGLMAALNSYQADLVSRGVYQYPDVYSVEFANSSLAAASIVVKGADKKSTPMTNSNTASGTLDPNKQSVDNSSRTVSIVAGTQVVQAIDLILRSSSYVTDQASVVIDENNQIQQSNGAPAQNLAWYQISQRTTPGPYDYKRNDYSYNITYVISAYKINQMVSDYFLSPTYKGVHKQYNYWFTGENTEVLSYEQNYNALYSAVLSGGPGGQFVDEAIKRNFQPRSGESSQGATGRVNEIGANAADFLYNPNDLQNVTLQIVGDPAWLQQGEAFCGAQASTFNFGPFLPDGTINYEAQQILFEILINTPNDYNLTTGLIDPNTQNTIFQNGAATPGSARQSYVYLATLCTSEFVKGKFTQVLKGSLLTYLPDQTFKENQQIDAAAAQTAINALSPNRQPAINLTNLASTISTPAFTPATSALGLQQINLPITNILGTQTTRPTTVPGLPTSGTQAVGLVNSVLGAPPKLPSSSLINTPGFNPAGDQQNQTPTADSVSSQTQTVAGNDDSATASSVSGTAVNNNTISLDQPAIDPADANAYGDA